MILQKKTFLKNSLILLIFLFGFILRFYNINYEDFWTDEIFAFFTSEPNITFKETLIRTLDSNFNCLFDFFLKGFHTVFSYDVHSSRYFSLIISSLTLIGFALLLYKITNYNSLLFGFFILCINIFHIRYSTEVRSYILTFLLAIIFIYLNFKDKNTEHKINISRFLAIICTAALMLLSHAFTILILGSLIFFKFIKFLKFKKIFKQDIILIIGLSVVAMLYLFVYLPINIEYAEQGAISPHWIKQVKLSFYTNYFFSQYFGSRILGLIYLVILLFLIIKFKNLLVKKLNIYSFFVILIFSSYLIPLVYGYLFGPVLIGRYVMFLLIPIISLLSHFIFLLENRLVKYGFIILICTTTFFNHLLYENTFKQFYTKINYTKPQIKEALKSINNSETKFFTIKKFNAREKNTNESYENYILKYLEKLNFQIKYFNYQKNITVPDEFWVIYIKDTTKVNFKIPEKFNNYEIDKKIYFNSLELIFIKKQI